MADVLPSANSNLADAIASFPARETEVSIPREYAWDFEKNDFQLKDGKFQVVEGIEALKIWIWKALKTSKYTYLIYSDNYGQELDKLIGKGLSKSLAESEAKRLTLECLKDNEHILSIRSFSVDKSNDVLCFCFTGISVCGEVTIDV